MDKLSKARKPEIVKKRIERILSISDKVKKGIGSYEGFGI